MDFLINMKQAARPLKSLKRVLKSVEVESTGEDESEAFSKKEKRSVSATQHSEDDVDLFCSNSILYIGR